MRKIINRGFIAIIAFCCLMPLVTTAQIWDINGSGQAKTTTSAPVTLSRSLGCDLQGPGLTITDNRTNFLCNPVCVSCPFLHFRSFDGANYLTRLIFDQNDNLGIGTDATQGRLHINTSSESGIFIERNSGIWTDTKVKIGISTNTGPAGLRFQVSGNGGASWIDGMHLAYNGRVGIGTTDPVAALNVIGDLVVSGKIGIGVTNPSQKLVVDGMICAREVRVSLNSDPCTWPDYVFKPDYNLMSLRDLETYVLTNNHLPNIPSAAQVAESGIEIGQMQQVLLQKIEELTLYIIELEKQNEQLQKRVSVIESQQ